MRVAIVLRGGVSKIAGRQLGVINEELDANPFINLEPCANSFKRHILEVNKNIKIDTYVHTWNSVLLDLLGGLYEPIKSVAEDNTTYKNLINERVKKSLDERVKKSLRLHAKSFLGLPLRSKQDLAGDFLVYLRHWPLKREFSLS